MFFGPFRFDEVNECVWRDAEAIPLTPKAFAVLRHLLRHPGRLATKEELLEAIWPKTYVGDAVLKVCIGEIRKALIDDVKNPKFIETVHRRGYRFIAPLREETGDLGPETSPPSSPASSLQPLASSFVGRDAELQRLHTLLEKAQSGERRIVFVTGDAGLGKTALIDAFLGRLETGDWRLASSPQVPSPQPLVSSLWVARGQCLEHYGAGEPYLPILEALGRLGREAGHASLFALLNRYAPTWLAQMPALVKPEDRQRLQRETLNATPERMLREMVEALAALTAETTLVLVLEDLHWSDYSTLDFLSALARRREPARLLVIGAYRPAEISMSGHPLKNIQQELLAHGLCEEIALTALGAREVRAYLTERFPSSAAPAELAPLVYKQTGGHPLFMVNAVAHLLNQGVVALRDGQWQVTRAIESVEISAPDSLRQLIIQQVERLTIGEQRALEAASLVGGDFSALTVAVALQTEPTVIEEVCDGLAQRGQFLWARGVKEEPTGAVSSCYQFAHSLYQHALAERVGAARRMRLQKRIGEWVESVAGERADEMAAELAMRFELSHDHARAASYLRKAGERAMRTHAPREAAEYLQKGLRLLQALPESPARVREELLLQTALGPALMAIHGYAAQEVERVYRRARELCELTGDSSQLFPVLWGLWLLQLVRAEFSAARTFAEQLLELAQSTQDDALLLQARNALGTTLYHLGEFAAARAHVEQGVQAYRADPHHFLASLYGGEDPGVVCGCLLALTLWMLGYPQQANQQMQETLVLARGLKHPFSIADVLGFAAVLQQYGRQTSEALRHAEELIATAAAEGFPYWQAAGMMLRGWAFAEQGQRDEGISQMQQGLAALRATGTELFRPYWLALLVEARGKEDSIDHAEGLVAEALELTRQTGESVYAAELWRLKGELLVTPHEDSPASFSSQQQPSRRQRRATKSRQKPRE